ncbi:MAG: hypothetical protein WC845_00425 [Candidatus Staskawiczbacteria bacterium]|jgi:hypothetical protein
MGSPEIQNFETIEGNIDNERKVTDEKLREGADKLISLFCSEFQVDGKEYLVHVQEQTPDTKFIIASSHISNLDAPAAIKALGDRVDIQVTAESVLFKSLPHKIMFGLGGKDNFTPLEYKKEKDGKRGIFNPKDFQKLSEKVEEGKTPWMAIHPFTKKGEMQPSKIGAVFLAQKTGAKIIPTALEFESESISLEGAGEITKGLLTRANGDGKATYHVGEPIDLAPIDTGIIELVFEKRAGKERVTREEIEKFKEAHRMLQEQANQVAEKIAAMLPENQRGNLSKKQAA